MTTQQRIPKDRPQPAGELGRADEVGEEHRDRARRSRHARAPAEAEIGGPYSHPVDAGRGAAAAPAGSSAASTCARRPLAAVARTAAAAIAAAERRAGP